MMERRNIIDLFSGASFVQNCPSEAFLRPEMAYQEQYNEQDNTGHFVSLSKAWSKRGVNIMKAQSRHVCTLCVWSVFSNLLRANGAVRKFIRNLSVMRIDEAPYQPHAVIYSHSFCFWACKKKKYSPFKYSSHAVCLNVLTSHSELFCLRDRLVGH